MCGIAGFVRSNGAPADAGLIKRMTDLVQHRGPNGDGHFVQGAVALGHRRLSVLDLSSHGAQPMTGENGRDVIVFNGEIYNYVELREQLQSFGHKFKTGTDTEVILAAYAQWGDDCVTHFNGMWAFAIHDPAQQRIFLSRDRFGVKPLYYCEIDGIFAFGSEIRQLLPLLKSRVAEMELVHAFLVTNGTDMDERSMFKGVRRLPASHNAYFDLTTGKFRTFRYFELARNAELASIGVEDATERLNALLESSIQLRLRSDVKVGTCLSGGMDSSSVAAVAASQYHGLSSSRFSAITAVSEQASNDESHFAQMVVESSSLDWHRVRPNYDDFVATLTDVVRAQEEPFGGPSLTMQYFVMKTARQNGITVLLDGQGGDEILLGYEKYYGAFIASSFRSGGVPEMMSAILATSRNNAKLRAANMVKYVLGSLSASARNYYYSRQHRHLRGIDFNFDHIKNFAKSSQDSFALQKLEIEKTNLPILLRCEDKNSMAHSIEARLPFLDYRMVQFCLSLPDKYKIRNGWSKWILRNAMTNRLPSAVTWRKNKFGFEAPDEIWLNRHNAEMQRSVEASPMIRELSGNNLSEGWLRLDKNSRWRLYSLALWEKEFGITA